MIMRVRGDSACATSFQSTLNAVRSELDGDRDRALQPHDRRIAVEGGLEVDDLVARMHQGADGGVQALAGAADDGHFLVGVVARAGEALAFVGNRRAQCRQPDIGAYWLWPARIAAAAASTRRGSQAKFGAPCDEVQRLMLGRELADDREDRRADIGQLGAGLKDMSIRVSPSDLPCAPSLPYTDPRAR